LTIDSGFFNLTPLKRHVVVCGFPRAGTTLVQAILETCTADAKSFGREINALSAAMLTLRNHSVMITKRPDDIYMIDRIRAFYQKKSAIPRFIVLIRDPRAILTSIHHSRSDYYVSVARWKSIFSQYEYVRRFPDVFVLRFEELIANVENIQSSLSDFIDFEFKYPFAEFYKYLPPSFQSSAMHRIRPIDPSTIFKWKLQKHRAKLKALLKDEMPELCERLIELEYESNDSWAREFF
jgi:hypothetical protein